MLWTIVTSCLRDLLYFSRSVFTCKGKRESPKTIFRESEPRDNISKLPLCPSKEIMSWVRTNLNLIDAGVKDISCPPFIDSIPRIHRICLVAHGWRISKVCGNWRLRLFLSFEAPGLQRGRGLPSRLGLFHGCINSCLYL